MFSAAPNSSCSCVSCLALQGGELASAPAGYELGGERFASATVTFSFGTTTRYSNRLFDFTESMSEPQKAVIREALTRWSEVVAVSFVEVADSSSVTLRIGASTVDGRGGTLATEQHIYQASTGNVIVSDIRFDVAESFTTAYGRTSGGAVSLYAVALHEIGHALGLAHESDGASLMNPTYSDTVVELTADDVAGARSIYGAAGPQGVVYRFYNTATGTHFFTASPDERVNVRLNIPVYSYEGSAFRVATAATSGTLEVYRFFNTATGTHFFTGSAAERDSVRASLPQFSYEGIAYNAYAGQVAGSTALYRFFNTATGTHFYTASAAERDTVAATLPSYRLEGTAYYVLT